ncbi:MAG: hypothetical protein PGN25_15045 [Methylorubrum populi]
MTVIFASTTNLPLARACQVAAIGLSGGAVPPHLHDQPPLDAEHRDGGSLGDVPKVLGGVDARLRS